jgi:hypothetical protein
VFWVGEKLARARGIVQSRGVKPGTGAASERKPRRVSGSWADESEPSHDDHYFVDGPTTGSSSPASVTGHAS